MSKEPIKIRETELGKKILAIHVAGNGLASRIFPKFLQSIEDNPEMHEGCRQGATGRAHTSAP